MKCSSPIIINACNWPIANPDRQKMQRAYFQRWGHGAKKILGGCGGAYCRGRSSFPGSGPAGSTSGFSAPIPNVERKFSSGSLCWPAREMEFGVIPSSSYIRIVSVAIA